MSISVALKDAQRKNKPAMSVRSNANVDREWLHSFDFISWFNVEVAGVIPELLLLFTRNFEIEMGTKNKIHLPKFIQYITEQYSLQVEDDMEEFLYVYDAKKLK